MLFSPSMRYKTVYGERALKSLENIEAYLSERSENGARKVLAEIQLSIELLAKFPSIGRELAGLDMRTYIARRYAYRIQYRVVGANIQILQIYHPRQSG